MQSSLSLYLLGPLVMESARGPLSIRYNKARALLAYLAIESGFHTRESLAFLLWPDASAQAGRENLRRMLFQLKDALSADLMESNREVLRLRAENGLWTDVAAFTGVLDAEQRTAAAGAPVNCERVAYAVSLYRGEFLQGLELDDAPEFCDWVALQRHQYQQRYLQALGMLVDAYEQEGNLAAAIERAQQWTVLAPLDNAAWHRLLRLLIDTDQLERARQEFQRYRQVLDTELGAPPDAKIARLLDAAAAQHGVPASRRAGSGERRQLTALSCEFYVTGEPEDVAETLLELIARCESVLRGVGGHVTRTPGGLVTYFGYPVAQEDAARRAVTGALACRQALGELQASGALAGPLPVQIGLGVHTGMVLSSVDDDIPDAGGRVARLALLLGAMSGASGVVVSETILRRLGPAFCAEAIGELDDRAGGLKMQAFLVNAATVQERADCERVLCGRERELAVLGEIRRKRPGRACLVRGEAGLGKSFLVEHFCAENKLERVVLRCVSELRQMPLHPFVAWMRALREKYGSGPSQLTGEVARLLEAIEQRMLPGEHPAWGVARFRGREELGSLFHDLLALLVPPGGVIYFDDVHWADPSTREVLALLVERPLPRRMLVITARPEFVPPWKRTAAVEVLELQPLDDLAIVDLVHSIVQDQRVDAEMLREIVKLSEGIPLYAEELTRDLLAGDRESGGPHVLPGSLHDLLMARIDSVGRARRVAQFAAVVGGEFTLDLLAEAMGEPRAKLAEAIAVMLRQNIVVRRGDQTYAFRHALLREAAYQSQTRSARAQAHARLAHVLEASEGDRNPAVLAWHYAGAGNRPAAVKNLLDAARHAAAQCAYREAVGYYRSALEWFEREGDGIDAIMEELCIRMELGIQLSALYGFGSEQAVDSFRTALTLAKPLGDDPRLFPIYWGLWTSSSSWANFSMTMALAETLLRMAESAGDAHLLSYAHYARGYSHFFLGNFADAVACLEAAVRVYQPPQRPGMMLGQDAKVTSLGLLSLAYWYVGRFDDALRASRESLVRAREAGHRYSLLYALVLATDLQRLNRNIDQMAVFSDEALQVAREMDAPMLTLCAETTAAWVDVARGRVDKLDYIAACIERLQDIMKGLTLFLISRWADACEMAQDAERGLHATEQGLKEVESANARFVQSEFERIKGELLFVQGKPVDVFLPWLDRALDTACSLDSPPLVLRALASRMRFGKRRPCAAQLALMANMLARVQGGDGLPEVRAAQDLLGRYQAVPSIKP